MWDLSDVSATTVCGNRNLFLMRAIKSWVKFPFKEIVVVDWSSNIPITYKMLPDDPRIKIFRKDGETIWRGGKAMNAAVRLTSCSMVFKFDCDIILHGGIPDKPEEPGMWYRGTGKLLGKGKDDNAVRTFGTWMAPRAYYDASFGYNENMVGWGTEDRDIYSRIAKAGYYGVNFTDPVRLEHIEHDKSIRKTKGGMMHNLKKMKEGWGPEDQMMDLSSVYEVPR